MDLRLKLQSSRLFSVSVSLRPVLWLGFIVCFVLMVASPRGPAGDDKSLLFFVSLALGVASIAALVYSPALNSRGSAVAALPLTLVMHGILAAGAIARGTAYPFAGSNFGEALNLSMVAVLVEWGASVALGASFSRQQRPAAKAWVVVALAALVLALAFAPALSYPDFEVIAGARPVRSWRFPVSHRLSQQTLLANGILVQIRQPGDCASAQVQGLDIAGDRRWAVDLRPPDGYERLFNSSPNLLPDGTLLLLYELASGGWFSSGTGPYWVVRIDVAAGAIAESSVVAEVSPDLLGGEGQWVAPPVEGPVTITREGEFYPYYLDVRGEGFHWRLARDNGSREFIAGSTVLVMREMQRHETWYHIWLLPP